MNTRNIEISNLLNFAQFYDLVKNEKLSLKTSYKLHRLAKEAEKHIAFYQEQMNNIIQEYCKKNENGEFQPSENGGYAIIEGKEEECSIKITELQNLEIEILDQQFSIDEFGSVQITPQELVLIEPFLID